MRRKPTRKHSRKPTRRNPSKATVLAAMQGRREPGISRVLRGAAPDDQTLDEALDMIEGLTGKRTEREASLAFLSEYFRNRFSNVRDIRDTEHAMAWLTMMDQRVGVWCAAELVQETLTYRLHEEEKPFIAVYTAQKWVVGRASSEQVRRAADRVAMGDSSSKIKRASASVAYAAAASTAEEASRETVKILILVNLSAEQIIDFIADAILTYPVARR